MNFAHNLGRGEGGRLKCRKQIKPPVLVRPYKNMHTYAYIDMWPDVCACLCVYVHMDVFVFVNHLST